LYNDIGDLIEIDYSDGTPSVVYADRDRRGLPRTVTDSTGTRTLSYDVFARVLNDGWTDGVFNGLSVSNHFHQYFVLRTFLRSYFSPNWRRRVLVDSAELTS